MEMLVQCGILEPAGLGRALSWVSALCEGCACHHLLVALVLLSRFDHLVVKWRPMCRGRWSGWSCFGVSGRLPEHSGMWPHVTPHSSE